jgi:hypothetical protein
MGADRVIYCLEKLTDYDQFERLCHDLMAIEGYKGIEPLGGSHDKGRDAIHVSQDGLRTTVFAYSVREDWLRKLKEDAGKIKAHGHVFHRMVFLVTAKITANERDNSAALVHERFGLDLEIYSLERLRVLLVSNESLLRHHPQIFPPWFFQELRLEQHSSVPERDLIGANPLLRPSLRRSGWAIQGSLVTSPRGASALLVPQQGPRQTPGRRTQQNEPANQRFSGGHSARRRKQEGYQAVGPRRDSLLPDS